MNADLLASAKAELGAAASTVAVNITNYDAVAAAVAEVEANLGARPKLHLHGGGEPLGELGRLGDGAPDLLRRVGQPSLEAQRGAPVDVH
jgi:hypothetical protein